jgi:sugar phosphate isomerase/epimerase
VKLIMFSKMLKEKSVPELVDVAREWGLDGWDLCVRPDYAVSPDNAAEELPKAVALFRENGLDIPMVTGNFDLLTPDHPTAEPILSAMDKADVRHIKLGYFKINPDDGDYMTEVANVRNALEQWLPLARKYGVKVCYHTHSNRCMGLNGASMAHLVEGFDPALIGAYMDPAHLAIEGEEIALALNMVKAHLSLIATKDILLTRVERNGHGAVEKSWVVAGDGVVDWTNVFESLQAIGYDGPISVHCEFKVPDEEFIPAVKREIAFFRQFVPAGN